MRWTTQKNCPLLGQGITFLDWIHFEGTVGAADTAWSQLVEQATEMKEEAAECGRGSEEPWAAETVAAEIFSLSFLPSWSGLSLQG